MFLTYVELEVSHLSTAQGTEWALVWLFVRVESQVLEKFFETLEHHAAWKTVHTVGADVNLPILLALSVFANAINEVV